MEQHCDLPDGPQAAGQARRLVRDVLETVRATHLLDDALLIVSELATNAVRYGTGPISAHISIDDHALTIAIQDGRASDLPYPKILTQTEPDGRGMHLVSAMASRWGWDRDQDSKVVWAEIPLQRD
ncbi:MAG: ATP-binding protein [Candidatus Nanopelagicales bacterium]